MVAKSPQPATREVVCTHCDHAIDIPATAMSVNCRYCHKRVIIEDVKIKAYHAVKRLATAGTVEVAKKAQVVAEVRVNDLIVEGSVKGNVTALGLIRIGKKGAILGDVSCRRLAVQAGGSLVGHVTVDPGFAPEPQDLEEE